MLGKWNAGAASLILFVTMTFFACGEESTTEPGETEPIVLPLAVGNQWVYEVLVSLGKASAELDTTTIIGTSTEGGQTWFLFQDRSDMDTTFLRQDGDAVYVSPYLDDPGGGESNALSDYLLRVVGGSRPWKFADFGVPSGTSWTIAEAGTTLMMEHLGQPYPVGIDIDFWGTSRGRVSITVQSGTYENVYKGEVHQLVVFTSPGTLDTLTNDMTYWVADGVGIVRTEEVNDDPFEGVVKTTTEDLVTYDLQ
jgi:hypothetical protein